MSKAILIGCVALLSILLYTAYGDDDDAVETPLPIPEVLPVWGGTLGKLQARFGFDSDDIAVLISVSEQELRVVKGDRTLRLFKVSTSKRGVGSRAGSRKTPLGTHRIAQKIGQGAKFGTIFNARCNTGRTARVYTDNTDSQQDQKTTRILWLKGLESGFNKGDGIDTFKRLIYIHGTPEEGLIGTPASNGCIRMRNGDVMELFDLVQEGTLVEIYNQPESIYSHRVTEY